MSRASDEELARAMAANVDAEGNDVALEAWVQTWTAAERDQANENVRRSLDAARRQILGDAGEI